MEQQKIHTHQFSNGLMLIVEEMRDVQSAAFTFMVPAGSVYEPEGCNGTASMLADWITRGAGEFDSRGLAAALDNLGLQHSENAGSEHITFSGATVATKLPDCLRLFAGIIRQPHLDEDQFEAVQLGAEQGLLAIEDEPQRKVMVELRKRSYQRPWSLSSEGSIEDLPNITSDIVRAHFRRHFHPRGAIIGIAGNVDPAQIIAVVGEAFGDWPEQSEAIVTPGERGPKRDFIEHDSAQTHIGLSYASVPFESPEYYSAWAAVSILSGGMSCRLFTEVREKRGLCYSVYASHSSLRHEGRVMCYAGTSNERAQETLDVTLSELQRLGDGIEDAELERCKARAKSSLIMQQESTRSRASSLARNWFFLGRVRTLQEVRDQIDALTVSAVLDHVHRYPARDFTVLSLGPKPLDVNVSDAPC